ncbi:TRAP transporter substrate-binding protein DctP [Fusibacter paucivorans]|uniref:TRAP transporter substrate-binding protein DctP n=1 Tax=Fusibacter paucivorans TaxID=76009 RepID=A0ABS5PJG8_9FIRM|nr:TRAP transporter substrate-binding protein DctP [Fusibacter paucivorans]MBS7525279.1 TRAP transporter substrate-binding protein DctP [Fusibacter paucivorans]
MLKKIMALLVIVTMVLSVFTGCGAEKAAEGSQAGQAENAASDETSATEPVTVKIAVVGNEDHQSTLLAQYFKEALEESDDSFNVEIYPNGALGGEREAAEGVKLGTIQMTIVTSDGALPAWVPDLQVLSIPYLFDDKEQAYQILDNVLQEAIADEMSEAGFVHLGFGELGFRHFTNNVREIKTAEDMKDLSVRVQEAPIWFALMDRLEAFAVPVSFNELYTALQQGMVDGQENPIATIATSKFNEVQKYLTLDGHTYAAVSMIMNKSFFDGLTEAQKTAIENAAQKAIPEQRAAVDSKESDYLAQLKESGMIVTEPEKESFKTATEGLYLQDEVKELVDPEIVELILNNK